MPTLFIQAGLRFFFVMFDLLNEPFHVHVGDKGKRLCKYWIFADGSFELADNSGFRQRELNDIEATLIEQMRSIQEAYGTYCTKNNIAVNYRTKRTI